MEHLLYKQTKKKHIAVVYVQCRPAAKFFFISQKEYTNITVEKEPPDLYMDDKSIRGRKLICTSGRTSVRSLRSPKLQSGLLFLPTINKIHSIQAMIIVLLHCVLYFFFFFPHIYKHIYTCTISQKISDIAIYARKDATRPVHGRHVLW